MEKEIIDLLVAYIPKELKADITEEIIYEAWLGYQENYTFETRILKKSLEWWFFLFSTRNVEQARKMYEALPEDSKKYLYMNSPEALQQPIKYIYFIIEQVAQYLREIKSQDRDPLVEVAKDLRLVIEDLDYIRLHSEPNTTMQARLSGYLLPFIGFALTGLSKEPPVDQALLKEDFFKVFFSIINSIIAELEIGKAKENTYIISTIANWETLVDHELTIIDIEDKSINNHPNSAQLKKTIVKLQQLRNRQSMFLINKVIQSSNSRRARKSAQEKHKKDNERIEPLKKPLIDFWLQPNPETGKPWQNYIKCVRAYEKEYGELPREERTCVSWLSKFDNKK